ncbi:HNH endonuclease [Leptospira sp. B5-022]|uniref:HNH endonuclease n=1 Tax=Leptospira sp. B5-022 TaxID=1242992 RepID=UPI000691D28A|nr:HNH endonuclease [Leptospira sp. B5-022]
MTISEKDSKILWGRAAGHCSNPDCFIELTQKLNDGDAFNLGEMAHIIARNSDGPRGNDLPEDNSYANLILLCPTCHTRVDKAPLEYPVSLLHKWKLDHEVRIINIFKEKIYTDLILFKRDLCDLLYENKQIWMQFGPESVVAKSDPNSSLHKLWVMRKFDTIIPNNRKIINIFEANRNIFNEGQWKLFQDFKLHATSFEENSYERIESYPRFPLNFSLEFCNA